MASSKMCNRLLHGVPQDEHGTQVFSHQSCRGIIAVLLWTLHFYKQGEWNLLLWQSHNGFLKKWVKEYKANLGYIECLFIWHSYYVLFSMNCFQPTYTYIFTSYLPQVPQISKNIDSVTSHVCIILQIVKLHLCLYMLEQNWQVKYSNIQIFENLFNRLSFNSYSSSLYIRIS